MKDGWLIWFMTGTLLMAIASGMSSWTATTGQFLAFACFVCSGVASLKSTRGSRKPVPPAVAFRFGSTMARASAALAASTTIFSLAMIFVTKHLAAKALADGFLYPQYAVAWWTNKLPTIFAGLAALCLFAVATFFCISKSLAHNASALNIAESVSNRVDSQA